MFWFCMPHYATLCHTTGCGLADDYNTPLPTTQASNTQHFTDVYCLYLRHWLRPRPNFGGALPQWCPFQAPGFGPGATPWWVAGCATLKRGTVPQNGGQTAQKRPRMVVSRGALPGSMPLCGHFDAHGAPLGHRSTLLRTSCRLFDTILGRFGCKCAHTGSKLKKKWLYLRLDGPKRDSEGNFPLWGHIGRCARAVRIVGRIRCKW